MYGTGHTVVALGIVAFDPTCSRYEANVSPVTTISIGRDSPPSEIAHGFSASAESFAHSVAPVSLSITASRTLPPAV
jgi:hypothetical protein